MLVAIVVWYSSVLCGIPNCQFAWWSHCYAGLDRRRRVCMHAAHAVVCFVPRVCVLAVGAEMKLRVVYVQRPRLKYWDVL